MLLLRSCLLPDRDAAAKEWAQLEPELDVRLLQGEAYGLLPLLHERLSEVAPDYRDLQLLSGVRQRNWYVNSLRFRSASRAVELLEAAGCEPRVGGGAAVLLCCLPDRSLRSLPDFELVLPEPRLEESAALLSSAGWSRRGEWRNGPRLERRAITLESEDGGPCSLQAGVGPGFEASDEAVDLNGRPASVLALPQLLVSVIVETGRAPEGPPMRWIADACLVALQLDLRGGWMQVPDVARARKASLRVCERLEALEALLGVGVPQELMLALREAPQSRREKLAERLQAEDRGRRTICALLRRTAGLGPLPTAAALPRHLAEIWTQPSPAQLPREAVRRLLGRR